jgi:hypothetical protein
LRIGIVLRVADLNRSAKMSERPSDRELSGMTVNERLFACGLMERWDVATGEKKKDEMISLLCDTALSKEQATWTVEEVLKRATIREDDAQHQPVKRTAKDYVVLWIVVLIAMAAAVWLALKFAQ